MPHDFEENTELGDEQINDLLDDIELRCSPDLAAARDMATVRRKVGIEIRPGNASARTTVVTSGDTTELKTQGLTAVTEQPIMVGDVFHLTFDRTALDVAPVLSVCDRCTMLGDASFEVRFRFVHEVALPAQSEN